MELAMVGLGKMGLNMAKRILRGGHRVIAYDPLVEALEKAQGAGAEGIADIEEISRKILPPRTVWVMVPSGAPTEEAIKRLSGVLSPDDVIIDGGNSNYKDSMRRAEELRKKGLHFLDAGTSGGVHGIEQGYSLMIGGEKDIAIRFRPLFETLAPGPDKGWGYVGPAGSGHFVKMVHNGIEYGLMKAYAEGFDILNAKKEFDLDLKQVAEIWRYGSVVRSWLLDLTSEILEEDCKLRCLEARVEDSGEGRWTVFEAIDLNVPAPVITLSLQMRIMSRHANSFASRMLSAMRNKFGGHAVFKTPE